MQDLRDAFLDPATTDSVPLTLVPGVEHDPDHESPPLASSAPIAGVEMEMRIETRDQGQGVDVNDADASLDDGDPMGSLGLDKPLVIKPRPYQKEMLRESLERNIIVAMDTGSGKTHIAVMRMQFELERIPPHQVVWFLAPTVALCEQQFVYIQSQITSVQSKFLKGDDGVERWTEQKHWDAVLKNMRIVVSTYQILLDALTHGFVGMGKLALIVFDEAHNCVKSHAGAKIMTNFYHKRKASNLSVPQILGLTASPVMRSDPASVVKIESTLNAICRTPKKHRSELRLQVKLPVLLQVNYKTTPIVDLESRTKTMRTLNEAFLGMDVTTDPGFLSLSKDTSERARHKLSKLRASHKTWCHSQMRSFQATASTILQELGAWAADYYVSQVVMRFEKVASGTTTHTDLSDISNAEKLYLAGVMSQIELSRKSTLDFDDLPLLSDKVTKLVEVLLNEPASFSGIVFVQERATAAVLCHLISVHPSCSRFRTGTIVGTSGHSMRARNIYDLIDQDEQKHNLSMFKSGQINLATATSVLEEGIDVPACNVVICFQAPANLKSFVQRRGRARHRDSKLVLLSDSAGKTLVEWQALEADMRKTYEDEMRALQEMLVCEDTEDHDGRSLRVQETGALVDMDNAVSHLYHFCAKLPSAAYVDRRPEFICSKENGFVRAEVVLPLSVEQSVRTAHSSGPWKSEKNAIKDAALQSYKALYQAGLVNDNLLPDPGKDIVPEDIRSLGDGDARASIEDVSEQRNPWRDVARAWETAEQWHLYTVRSNRDVELSFMVPMLVRGMPKMSLYWDGVRQVDIEFAKDTKSPDPEFRSLGTEHTWALLNYAFGARFQVERKPFSLQAVMKTQVPSTDGVKDIEPGETGPFSSLIRDRTDKNTPYLCGGVLPGKPDIGLVQKPYQGYENSLDSPHLILTRVSKRVDLFRKPQPSSDVPSKKPYSIVLPLSRCMVDEMPLEMYDLGRLIPSIAYQFEKHLLAEILMQKILTNVHILDLAKIVRAITASSASDELYFQDVPYEMDYQCLEFFGDTVLKLYTSVHLMAKYPMWHEGYLTELKGRIVSNSSLYAAAISIGLDQFIITKQFNGHKWRPTYVDDLLAPGIDEAAEVKRPLSSKVPADVLEALLGACFLDGGEVEALECLKTLLPRLDWQTTEHNRSLLFQRAPDVELPATLEPLEGMIGYAFRKKGLLVEAVTHASCASGSASLERLEFLGDAVLDYLVVQQLWNSDSRITFLQDGRVQPTKRHVGLHRLRTALVNADFLAFLSMELHIEQETIDLAAASNSNQYHVPPEERHTTAAFPLWKYMRHASPAIAAEQLAAVERHRALAPAIRDALSNGTHYPWALLARLQAPKFLSDMVESLLGALWIDSDSDSDSEAQEKEKHARSFLAHLGLTRVMERLLAGGVQVLHPKEELGMLADAETVLYQLSGQAAAVAEGGLVCRVLVGEREVVCVTGGVSRVEVETRAAQEAVRLLQEEKEREREAEGARDLEGRENDAGNEERDAGGVGVDIEMGNV